jgi:uncharacterized phage-associated protein
MIGKFDSAKFAELTLYIANQSREDPWFGAVKLNKLLYYADFYAYRRLGSPITGAEYQKLSEGPVPRQMLPIREMLIDSQDAVIQYQPYFNGVQQRIVPLREPDITVFQPGELGIVDETIAALWNMSGRQVSDLSHTEIGWIAAAVGETIPYETAWLSSDPLPQEAEDYWRKVAASYGG